MNNKKVLGISIVAVLVLVVAIVATSYAAFTTNLQGTKENVIRVGNVALNCAETTFNITNANPAANDAAGIAQANAATCKLTSTMNGDMIVGYDIALANVDADTPNDALGAGNIKIQASKKVDSGTATYLAGSSASAGVVVSSLSSKMGKYDTSLAYTLDSATLRGNHTVDYVIKSWIATAPATGNATTATNACSDSQYTTAENCTNAGEIWGPKQTQTQSGGSFSFKLKIGATQTTSA